LIPVGAFLAFHMYENSQSRFGLEHYNMEVVEKIRGMNYVWLAEILVIALPILFHAIYGIVIWLTGRANVTRYGYLRNWMYWVQRISGLGVLLFLIVHVGGTRIYSVFDEVVYNDLFTHMRNLLSNPAFFAVYVVGMVLAALHFGNGLWTFGITWGLTTSPKAQRLSFVACMGVTAIIIALGLHSLVGFFIEHPDSVVQF
jgi:succinate dehydrogenase / fumarate reductase cytochrome b subunit